MNNPFLGPTNRLQSIFMTFVVSTMLVLSSCAGLDVIKTPDPANQSSIPELPAPVIVQNKLPPLLLALHDRTTGYQFPPFPEGTVTLETTPPVDGKIQFDQDTGLLRYTPAITDLDEFSVSIYGHTQGISTSLATLNVAPIPTLPPERRYIDNDRPVPKLPIYNGIRISPSTTEKTFNGVERITRTVTVSGFEVRFDPSDKHAELNRFSGSADIHQLNIEADSVIIRGQFKVPQTEVRISARRLVFEDTDPDKPAHIDTTPLNWPVAAGDDNSRNTPSPGKSGFSGGDIHLILSQLVAGDKTRLIMNGGRGQDPEPGRRGDDGKSVKSWTHKIANTKYPNVIYVQTHSVTLTKVSFKEPQLEPDKHFKGTENEPTNGENGVSAGRPGNGGSGGNLITNHPQWQKYAQQSGGLPGQAFGPYPGGQAGTPKHWKKIREKRVTSYSEYTQPMTVTYFVEEKKGNTHAGNSSEAVFHGSPGSDGIVITPKGEKKSAWLTTSLLRLVVERLRDVYLAGRTDQAIALIKEFGPLASQLQSKTVEEHRELIALQKEMSTLTHRLSAGLDYFGNPPGWVPNLSVEVNYSAFQQEIDSAIRMYYLSYWLNRHWSALDQKTEALDRLITLQEDQIESHRQQFANSSALLPILEAEQQKIDANADLFLEKLQAREKELAGQASDNVRRRAALRTINLLGEIVVSHKKPTAYAIFASASSEDVENILNPDSPLTRGDTVLDAYRRITSNDEVMAVRKKLRSLDPSEATDPEAFTRELLSLGEQLGSAMQASGDAFLKSVISDDEVQAELDRLKAQDSSFAELIDDLLHFLAQKRLFIEKTAEAVQMLETTTDNITKGWLSVDTLTRARDNLGAKPSTAVAEAIRNIREKARERLVLYQYYLAKAYEYRILEPYPGDFRKNRLFEKLTSEFESTPIGSNDPYQPPELAVDGEQFRSLRAIYLDDLRSVASAIITGLNENRPEPLEVTRTFRLSQSELDRLNDHNEVSINLAKRGLISDNDVNTRIVGIEILPSQSDYYAVVEDIGRSPVSNLEITIAPSGESILRWANTEYAFDYRRRQGVAPVRWGYSWDAITGTGQKIQHSDDALSLLSRLLDNGLTPVNQARIRFLPGARGDILIRKEVRPQVKGESIRINELTLAAKLQLYKTYQSRTLSIHAGKGITVKVMQPDLTGRGNGRENFHRFYSPGQQVTIEVPANVGEYVFTGWYDTTDQLIENKSNISITMDSHTFLRPKYALGNQIGTEGPE